ncbi:MAG TPA: hypothetical protein VHR39_06460 [Propionibacteriaceae bacterium]|jgi:hypothetical protein|nr:hypothetical protein [Propionibacteriaceae bacterium]
MSQAPIVVAGIPIPSDSPAFLAVLSVHVLAGLACVLTGLAAISLPKGRGRHSQFGTLYYRGLLIVWVTMAALAAVRWAEDYHLFVLGTLALAAAVVARRAVRRQHVRLHLIGMGSSYILLLTAFYVDNGAHLLVWRDLPPVAYWLVPAAVGLPIIGVTLRRHPLAQAERRQARPGAAV